MSIFSKLSFRNMKQNRNRTIITIIGVILATAMISGLTSLIASIQGYLAKSEIAQRGSWEIRYERVNPEQAASMLESPDIKKYVSSQEIGYAKIESENPYKPYLYIMGVSSDFTDIVPLYLTEGKMPSEPNEIILPQHFLDSRLEKFEIGDQLNLEVGKRFLLDDRLDYTGNAGSEIVNEEPVDYSQELSQDDSYFLDEENPTEELRDTESKTYTITGFFKRYGLENYSAPGYTAITAIDQTAESNLNSYYLEFNNPKQVFEFQKKYPVEGTSEVHNELLRYYGLSRNDNFNATLLSLTIIFLAMILISSIVLINNAFTISLAERTKQFGLLSSIGASKKQLRRTVLTEAMMISLIGIPLGILGGLLGIKLTLMVVSGLIKDMITSSVVSNVGLELIISSKAIIASVIIALFTVLISAWIPAKRASRITVMDTIRQTQDIVAKPVKVSKVTYKLFGLPGYLATKYFKRSRKKYRSTIISLSLSILLFISAYTFTSMMTDSIENIYSTKVSDLEYYCRPEAEDDSEIIVELNTMHNRIKDLDHVTSVNYTASLMQNYVVNKDNLTSEYIEYILQDPNTMYYLYQIKDGQQEKYLLSINTVFIEDDIFAEMLEQFNIDLTEYLSSTELLPIVKNNAFIFDMAARKYVTYDVFNTSKKSKIEIELVNLQDIPDKYLSEVISDEDSTADSIFVFRNYAEDTIQEVPLSEAFESKQMIEAEYFTDKMPSFLDNRSDITLLFPISKMADLAVDSSLFSISFHINSDNHQLTENALAQYNAELANRGDYVNHVAYRQNNKNLVTIVNIFCYGFIVLISLIALTNVFNTITTNINLRTRDFAMLKSVGMSNKGIRKMMIYECLLYGTRSLLWGLPLSLGVSYLIYRAIDRSVEQSYTIPWIAIAIVCISVFLFVAISMIYALRQFNKKNILESLKNEND
ncbi:MAG: ABC transporter permease [Clostridiaceae bacterium]|nr:ABC transporter permease [Clostridiaceae bacterium]